MGEPLIVVDDVSPTMLVLNNARFGDPYRKNRLVIMEVSPLKIDHGPALTPLQGTVTDENNNPVSRPLRIFKGTQFSDDAIANMMSASDGTFSFEAYGNHNDEFSVVVEGRSADEDNPIETKIKGKATNY